MSRVGKMPVVVPKGVDVTTSAEAITVKGSLGTMVRPVNALVNVKSENGRLLFEPADESPEADAMSGTMRALVANMVGGVTKGFEKRLALVGVGYRAQAQGSTLNLQVGYSHPVAKQMPRRGQGRVPVADRDRDQGLRRAGSRPGRRRGARVAPARALQGQGHPLRRREGFHQGNQEEVRKAPTC